MNVYLLVHRAPVKYTGTAATSAAWKAWFEELGHNLVDPGNAVFDRTAVGPNGSALLLGGYTIVTAESVDAAIALAESCPILAAGGGVEVGTLTAVPGRQHPARTF